MKRKILPHPRVLDDPDFAEVYFRHNIKRGKKIAQNYIARLKALGFKGGKILDAGWESEIYTFEIADIKRS